MNAHETLHYAIGESRLGAVVAATSGKGVAAILMADDGDGAVRELRNAFPGATLVEDPSLAGPAAEAATRLVDSPRRGFDLPLDLRGSELELAVWQALRAIPPGETRSYGALARVLPVSATAQEVGAACAANRIAVAVPCHRVVKADGGISGYRWGVSRKRQLIALERAVA
jgi:AraC family transcriptional regulator of adaptative response/methylated-DNA-[protein]-cysteine methyltransferase